MDGIADWKDISPDRHHDWIGQRDAGFQKFYPVASKAAKAGQTDAAVFRLYSNGYKTSRDAYIYNFSREACAESARRMVKDYQDALNEQEENEDPLLTVEDVASRHSSNVRWDQALKDNLGRRKKVKFSPERIWKTQYRPFVKQNCYVDYVLVNRKYQMDSIFPAADSENRAICVPGGRIDQAVFGACRGPDAGSRAHIEGAMPSALSLCQTYGWWAVR